MIVGVIKTKDLIRHPREVISIHGLRGFFRLILRALSRKKYQFIDFMEITSRTLLPKSK